MKNFRRMLALLMALVMVFALAACSGGGSGDDQNESGDSLQAVKDRGVLRVGVKEDVPGFGMRNTSTNEIEGFEIDLARRLAKEILGDENAVEFTAVTAKTRGPLVDNGELDMVIATFTITDERKETYNFSTSYYTDAVGLLVKTDSGYNSLADMEGAVIGVAQSSTSRDAVQAEADNLNVNVTFSEYATYPEIKAALDSGRVQAFCVDRSILRGYLDDTCVLLDDQFNPQDYGVCIKKSNTELAEAVDGYIQTWLEDGTIADMIATWNL